MNNLKLGILIESNIINNIYNNGINLNALIWYNIFEECKYNVYFIINEESKIDNFNYKLINYNYKDELDLDIIFTICFFDLKLLNNFKKRKILINLGNKLANKTFDFCCNLENTINYDDFKYNEIWISPHFEYSKFFYDIYWKKNVYVCPFIWEDKLIKNNKINYNFDKLNIGIVEPNLNPQKNCIIPICICEKAIDYINHVYVFNSINRKDNKEFIDFIARTNLFIENKISFEKRYKLLKIFEEYCNCLISFSQNWDLNYVHLECFYLGIPIIHNSKMLKNYGYYYPDYDIDTAVNNIKYILNNHNKDEYILRHKAILDKFSIYNNDNKNWIISRINETTNLDFEIN